MFRAKRISDAAVHLQHPLVLLSLLLLLLHELELLLFQLVDLPVFLMNLGAQVLEDILVVGKLTSELVLQSGRRLARLCAALFQLLDSVQQRTAMPGQGRPYKRERGRERASE